MENHISKRKFINGLILKFGVILSCILGIYFQSISNGFMSSSLFLYFTIQSNIWVAAICFIFLIFDLKFKGKRKQLKTLYIIKFMFTVSIGLTFMVFSLLLMPLMPLSYLVSPSNLLLHNITPLLAIIDFVLYDFDYISRLKHSLFGVIMPIIYLIITLTLSFNGVLFGEEIVPYFFLNYEKLGWVTIGSNGIGVVYWVIIMSILIIIMGIGLLKGKDHMNRKRN